MAAQTYPCSKCKKHLDSKVDKDAHEKACFPCSKCQHISKSEADRNKHVKVAHDSSGSLDGTFTINAPGQGGPQAGKGAKLKQHKCPNYPKCGQSFEKIQQKNDHLKNCKPDVDDEESDDSLGNFVVK